MLEKALVDEHQYRSGKAALDAELKAMLAKQQEALGPNDEVSFPFLPRRVCSLYIFCFAFF